MDFCQLIGLVWRRVIQECMLAGTARRHFLVAASTALVTGAINASNLGGFVVPQSWIAPDLVFQGRTVRLIPLETGRLKELFEASQDPAIWTLTSVNYSQAHVFDPHFQATMAAAERGSAYPFLILDASGSKVIGTTRYLDIAPEDKRLEIGVTWIRSEYFGTAINMECKFLLLEHCFETLKANRVQFKAKSTNVRSRRALEKIGARFEGVLRKDKIEPGGSPRDTAYYSIIDDDWADSKARLMERIERCVGSTI